MGVLFSKVLIANRGEIAVRIARALFEMHITSVAIYSNDDKDSLHISRCDEAVALNSSGTAAYLDADAIISAAIAAGCDAIHPGYGFLSEVASFAESCVAAGIVFIGPSPSSLTILGDKGAARQLAKECAVPLARGTFGATSLAEAKELMASLGGRPIMIKALAGGGGRGVRVVEGIEELPDAFERAGSEAKAAFGSDLLYVEELIRPARHIEVQIIGDSEGQIIHLFERECSLQRRNQKIVELAPAPVLSQECRLQILDAAVALGKAAGVSSLCTMEFLLDVSDDKGRFVFMEANPRLQVEHTVTEEVMGVDLVQIQIALAAGKSLAELGLTQEQIGAPKGMAVQLRINMEQIDAQGMSTPTTGRLRAFAPPNGVGIRVDTFGYTGYETNSNYDALLAKVIAHTSSDDVKDVLAKAYRALCEFRIEGVATNLSFLQGLITHDDVTSGHYDTSTITRLAPVILSNSAEHRCLYPNFADGHKDDVIVGKTTAGPEGTLAQPSPMGGLIVEVFAKLGDELKMGQSIAVIEAMKMEHVIKATVSGTVAEIAIVPGASVTSAQPLIFVAPADFGSVSESDTLADKTDQDTAAQDLKNWREKLSDEARAGSVAKQHSRDLLTARERVAALADPGSFVEIGGLVRNPSTEKAAPADGIIVGSCKIDGRPAFLMAQDFTVMGGSAGHIGDKKMVRVAQLALKSGAPIIMILDGGGHRIQDGQSSFAYAGATPLFQEFARLSGWVPIVAAVLGFGFAANTNFAAMADYVVMLRGKSTMGLAGPALVKAGTGETISAMALGGSDVQVDRLGLADGAFDTEDQIFAAIRAYLSYLPSNAQSSAPNSSRFEASDQNILAQLVPHNTRKAYNMNRVIEAISDVESVFEHKPYFAKNIITAFARIEGRVVGFIANQPMTLAGMLDAPSCEKAARFIALCDAFGLPLIYLIDIPGMSIGSAAEQTVLGRRSAKMLFELGHATVPRISIVLRKGYGLGYLAMAGGRSFDADGAFAWPSAEICAMSVEGSVDVAYRKTYEAADDPQVRRQELISDIRKQIGPLQAAEGFGIDDLILPSETRARIVEVLDRTPQRRASTMPPKFRAIPPI